MALTPLFQRYDFTDANLNAVLQDYRLKMNDVIDYFLDTDFGSLALYDTDKSDTLSLKWNEDDSNPRTLNFKVNSADRTINLSANLTVEATSIINSDLSTDANWATSGSITAGTLILRSNNELRFYDNGNYVGFEAPALSADCIWVLPTVDGGANEVLYTDGSKTLAWGSYAGNVTATANFGTDNVLIRSDGTLKALQHSGIVIDNSDNISGIGTLTSGDITVDGKLVFSAGSITDGDGAISFGNEDLTTTGTITLLSTLNLSRNSATYVWNTTAGGYLLFGTNGAAKSAANAALKLDTSSDATFKGNITMSSATSTITGGTSLFLEAASYVESDTINNNTTGDGANMRILTGDEIFRSTSARKYKANIENLEVDSSLIYNLRVVSFNSLGKKDDKEKRYVGLIADEIEQIYPEIVNYNNDNEVEDYDNQMLMTLILAEVQKLRQELDELKK